MSDKRTYAIEDIMGVLLLIAALFVLGFFNFKSDEPLVEAGLRSQAAAIVAASTHGMQVEVEGRKIRLSGLANTDQERTDILTALKAMDGRGRIYTDVTVLDAAAPFTFTVWHKAGAAIEFAGSVPTEAFRAQLHEEYGDGVVELTLAAGMPDADWPDVAWAALRALMQLSEGTLHFDTRTLQLTGSVQTPEVAERATLLMADLPNEYVFVSDFKILDDGTPLRLAASRNDGNLSGLSGKVPADLAADLPDGDVQVSPLEMPFGGWEDAVLTGLAALEPLHSGHLSITGPSLTLTGAAWSQDAYDRSMEALDKIPAAMSVSRQITLADSGAPFGLRLVLGQAGVVASGKVPRSLAPGVIAALTNASVEASELEIARISPDQDWWQAASMGAEALRYFETAEVEFDGTTLKLAGVVQDPPQLDQLKRHLSSLPASASYTLDADLIDDGTPLRLVLVFDGQTALASGKLPDLLRVDQLAAPLGAPVLPGKLVHTPKPGPDNWSETVVVAVGAFSLFERGRLDVVGTEITLRGVLRDPATERQVLALLNDLPKAYTVSTDISFQDDGRPFGFRLNFDGVQGELSGKVPLDLGPASQAAILGYPIEASTLEFAQISADADWWIAARSGLKALSGLKNGVLTLDAHQISLSGTAANSTVVTAARARLEPFEQAFKIKFDIVVE